MQEPTLRASVIVALAPPPDIDALLAVTGYSAELDDITSLELARGVCGGSIAVVAEARPRAEARFGCRVARAATLAGALADATQVTVTDLEHVTSQLKALRVDGVSPFFAPSRYPLVGGNLSPHLTHFIMTGVTAITRETGAACDKHGASWLTAGLRETMAGADYVHVSNEVSVVAGCKYIPKTLQFCTKESDLDALLDLHTNVVELTGNHMRDFGDAAARKTLDWYEQHGMKTFGGGSGPSAANRPLVLPLADGGKLGLVGFNELCEFNECTTRPGQVGANPYDDAKAFADIAKLRDDQHVDQVFVTVQFREWYSPQPTATQTRISHALIDHGADLVLGSQSHQLQRIELYKNKPIYYGLGNFLFDQIQRTSVRQGFILHHFFFHGRLVQSVPVFTYTADDRQPTLASPEQAAAMRAVVFSRGG